MSLVMYAGRSVIVLGGGTDAGGISINLKTGEVKPIPGWEIARFQDLQVAASALENVTAFKNPRMLESVAAPLAQFMHEEMDQYVGDAL